MSISAAHAAAFFAELSDAVWSIEDDEGLPAPMNSDGDRVMPFWSMESRALTVVQNVPAYQGFTTRKIGLSEWRDRWLPGLERDRILVGINWSGDRATGFDFTPQQVLNRLDAVLSGDVESQDTKE